MFVGLIYYNLSSRLISYDKDTYTLKLCVCVCVCVCLLKEVYTAKEKKDKQENSRNFLLNPSSHLGGVVVTWFGDWLTNLVTDMGLL